MNRNYAASFRQPNSIARWSESTGNGTASCRFGGSSIPVPAGYNLAWERGIMAIYTPSAGAP